MLLGLLGSWQMGHAAEFTCPAGESGVTCLIAAIKEANANGEANTITLEAGTYTLTAVDNDTDGPNGLPSVTSTLTIQGAGAETTVIEREPSAPLFRLGHVAATGTLTVDRLTLQGGVFRVLFSISDSVLGGAGLFNQGGILTLTNATLANNQTTNATQRAGGGGLLNNGGTVTLATTLLTRNVGGFGGGLCNNGGTVLLVNSTVSSNGYTLNGTFGGGILNGNGGVLSLIHSTLTGNTGEDGGGLANRCGPVGGPFTSLPCGTATIIESTIANNRATNFNGGGISNGGTLTLLNSTVAHNAAGGDGGGIVGSAIVSNSTIADNNADRNGGGIAGSAVLVNTILARNRARALVPDCFGAVTSLGTNLIGDPTGCPITLQPTDLTGDPGLGAFTDNGTPGNGHFPLLPTSQAIDAGNDAACPPTDQLGRRRGDIRKVGTSLCDIGAIEFRHRDDRQHDEEND
jgi:hypothetical protein